ncbi:uncharacterized protein LOC119985003 [Tripterygium wilfordii]|uniref:uncharacterized protein LOC119985003 n=1 Tax=Tripterygium wilfordii TaxID=458696 RepID=UPI0018F83E84|nr:uncharacterized protein LOC119985003 [Tripterygium wilfordii]
MSSPSPILKKPKTEDNDDYEGYELKQRTMIGKDGEENGSVNVQEQEEALVALIEHRTREVEHLKRRVSYYKSELESAENKLQDSHLKLARLRGRVPSKRSGENAIESVKRERKSTSPIHVSEGPFRKELHSKSELLIPANPKVSRPIEGSATKPSIGSNAQSSPSTRTNGVAKVKAEQHNRDSADLEVSEVKDKVRKRKIETKEHKELISLIGSRSSPCTIRCHTSNHISSQHKRKLRSLVLCPVNEQLFVTNALDGMVNLWQIQSQGSGASLLSTTDCASPKKRWPEDIAWHPQGDRLFAVYSADGGDSQISILNLNKAQGKSRVTFLEDKPHFKGIINSTVFLPWENECFATGGSDHAVILWTEKGQDNLWKPKALHRNLHSSAVMGVAGMQQKQIVLSAGADKRIIGFDAQVGRADFKHSIDSKCMSVLANPCDFNLFMVQTGTHEKQLRLYDIRLRQTELHAFGWKQESSDSHSALINQSWSPDGLYISSGSADPVIHIFDIRYNSRKPSQSVRAHQKRVFKAEWHQSLPLLISISSDLHIGFHKVS